jgi:hypothetical protein
VHWLQKHNGLYHKQHNDAATTDQSFQWLTAKAPEGLLSAARLACFPAKKWCVDADVRARSSSAVFLRPAKYISSLDATKL